ncbi:hypothetical protein DFJ73DRAFT_583855 [Zopfochytrium polystomum]|nr:hypothetical protein DFJ73DRAFT_583855 [Zopfochytrium polystomum]
MERQHLAEATSDSSTSDSDSDDSSPGPPSDIVALGRAGTPDAGLWLHGRAPIRPVPDELKPKDQSPSPVPPQLHSSQLPLRPNSAASSNGRATPQPAPSQLQQQVHIPPRKHFRAVDSDGNMVWTSGNTNANTGVNGTEGSRASAGGSLPGVSRPAATAAGVGGVAMRTRTPSAPLATGSWLLAAQGPSPSDVGSDSAATATDITGNRKSLGSFL